MSSADIRSRIVGHGEESPEQLLANPLNFRIHPKFQQDALLDVLEEVGWVQSIIVNRTTGNLVDGHLRVSLALRQNLPSIPVSYVELEPDEEALVLATLDPLAGLAITDKEKLGELLEDVSIQSENVTKMLSDLAAPEGTDRDPLAKYTNTINVPQYQITGQQPAVVELYNDAKTRELRERIGAAKIPEDIREYLLAAAARHTVFHFGKAAEYYAHATPEVQRLMEESALVIIDFDDAMARGFVKLTNTLQQLLEEDSESA